ncbi:MAG: hypothetical protein IJE78_00410 [Bacteroidaceae bacterium]|nr:hypothetical protein [Bacteroidaceae bacterium]
MAGAEFKITDQIDDKIFQKLEKMSDYLSILGSDFDMAAEKYAKLARKMGEQTNSTPKNLEELTKKSQQYSVVMDELMKTQKELSELQEKYKRTLSESDTLVKQAVANAREDARAKKDAATAELQLAKAETERVKQQKMNQKEQKKQKLTIEEAIALSKTQAKSINEARAQNSALRQVIQDLNLQDEEQLKIVRQLNATIDDNNNMIKRNSDELTQNKMTVGDYKKQVKLAIIELKNSGLNMNSVGIVAKGFAENLSKDFSSAWKTASQGGTMFVGVLKLVRTALLATGIGAIIAALSSLAAMFTRTQKGVELFGKAGASVTAGLDVLLDRLAVIGDSVVKVFSGDFKGAAETARRAVAGIGEELQNEINLSWKLKDALNQLEKQEVMLTMRRAASKAEIEQLKKDAEDTTKSLGERMEAAQKAYELEKKDLEQQTEIAEKRLANTLGFVEMNDEVRNLMTQIKNGDVTADDVIAKLGLSESNIDDLKEFSEQFVGLQELVESSYTRQTEQQNKLNQLRKDAYNKAVELKENEIAELRELDDIRLQLAIENGERVREETKRTYDRQIEDLKARIEKEKGLSMEQRTLNAAAIDAINQQIIELEKKKNKELNKLAIEEKRTREEINASNTIASTKDFDKQLEAEIKLLEVAREREIEEAEKTGADVALIDAKYEELKLQKKDEYAQKRIEKESKTAAKIALVNEAALQEELGALDLQYAKGLIREEDYQKKRENIVTKYAVEQARASLAAAKTILEDPNLSPESRLELEEEIAQKEIDLANAVRDAEISAARQSTEAQRKKIEGIADAIEQASQLMGALSNFASTIYEGQIQRLEEHQEESEKASEAELARIDRLAETGAITTEEAEARKRAAEEKTAKRNEELEKKKAALQTRQAKLEKATNIVTTIMNTAVAIMKAWSQAGIFAAPMAAMIAAMGAVQLSTIVAQPIPKYAKGTKSHKGGLAWVGDGGERETVITKKGMYITPDTPTLIDLPKGAKVLPYELDIEMIKGNISDIESLIEYRNENNLPPININNDYKGIEKRLDALEDSQRRELRAILRAIKGNDYKQFGAMV